MRREDQRNDPRAAAIGERVAPDKDYLTTTELAKCCGVSRFTILNWINLGKIRAVRTVGGHYRISASEAISFLEAFHLDTFHNEEEAIVSGPLGHCWEYPQKTNCDKECKDCLIYGREIDYCFVVVRQFGKEVIRCKADCLSCGYFEEFFGFDNKQLKQVAPSVGRDLDPVDEKRDILRSFALGVRRSVHRPKSGVEDKLSEDSEG